MNSWHTKVPVQKGQGGAPGGVSSLTILSIGGRALFHGESGRTELVVVELGEPETDWFIERYGGGVRIAGRTFIPADQVVDLSERLEFVSRTHAD
jgi:hypothetical protein